MTECNAIHATIDELLECAPCNEFLEDNTPDHGYTSISKTVAAYNDMLNECYGTVHIAGAEFDTAHALNKLDPIAYKCGWIDWCDAEGIDTDELENDYTFDRDRL